MLIHYIFTPPPKGGGRCKKYGTAVCPFFVGHTTFFPLRF
ncbi:hypothetical protein NMA510612_0801 [Neisseria meningitidis]|uniref:Uncharacterized protein n=1 Tax=Neisseria meningitidis TaxID=487 RepID=X5F7G6_NEIME|nr:hypothetical protein NMA510612_0801 [Neisseria meningitidis]